MSEPRSRRLRGLQPDTQLGLCFICQEEFQINAVRRYIQTNCCGAYLHRSCFVSMTTRSNNCGNCRVVFGNAEPEIRLEADEELEADSPPPSNQDFGLNIEFTGTHEYYRSFLRSEIDSYIREERYATCHRHDSPSWLILPLNIHPGVWLIYYGELLLFAERFYNQSLYIHARVNLPVHDSQSIRFLIYSLFVYNTPYSMLNLINGISFRILFNYEPSIMGVEFDHLELLPSGGGPPLYADDNINQMINSILNS
jgi:hypothetical protein